MRKNLAFVISGPSGVGKTTVSQMLLDSDPYLSKTISYTTRPPRKDEENLRAYNFVSMADFEAMRKADKLLEYARVYGDFYGTAIESIQNLLEKRDVLLVLDVNGCKAVKKALPDSCIIFLVPPKLADLKARLMRRNTESEDKVETRLLAATEEISTGLAISDFVIVNDSLPQTLADVIALIRSRRIQSTDRDYLLSQLVFDGV